MHDNEKLLVLKNSLNFWDKLDKSTVEFLDNYTREVTYADGQNVHSGEDECVGVIFVKSGRLRVYLMSDQGKEVTLYRLEKGDICILSASCVMEEITFDVHIDSETITQGVLLSSNDFLHLMKTNIYFENFANKLKAQRFSDVMWTMQQILFYSFDKRLAIFLHDELVKNGNIITYSHMEIAKYLGSAREVVSRMLKYFENEGIVKASRKEIEIIDKKKLIDHIN